MLCEVANRTRKPKRKEEDTYVAIVREEFLELGETMCDSTFQFACWLESWISRMFVFLFANNFEALRLLHRSSARA